MSKTIMKKEMVNNSYQTEQKEKNIDYLMREINTLVIFDTDIENIFNSDYLEKCLEKLESDEYHIIESIRTIKERIREIEENSIREKEVEENIIQIEELERFIENVCDTDEDKEDPLSKIEELLEENDWLNEQISQFYEKL